MTRSKLVPCVRGKGGGPCCANGLICPQCGAHGVGPDCKASDCERIAAERTKMAAKKDKRK